MGYEIEKPSMDESLGMKARYSWRTWANGNWWHLTAGDDFTVTPGSFRATAHTWGQRNGFSVRAIVDPDGQWVEIKFTRKETARGT